jgi:hypothetical protein
MVILRILFCGWSVLATTAALGCSNTQDLGTRPSSDAAPSEDGSSGNDARADVPSFSDASANDAGAYVGPGSSFCSKLSPQPTFCADFDEGAGSLSGWQLITDNFYGGDPSGGTVSLDTSTSTSAPASAHQATLANPDAGVFRAMLFNGLGVTASEVTLSADMLLASGTTTPGSETIFANLSFVHTDGTADEIDVDLDSDVVSQSIPAGSSPAQGIKEAAWWNLQAGLMRGAWHRVSMDVVAGPPATLKVTIDSSVVLSTTLDSRFTNGTVKFGLGLMGGSGSSGLDMHVDNVVVDTKP